ncbi:MAG: BrnT family toxin [Pyrinomonadaceae bacterium]
MIFDWDENKEKLNVKNHDSIDFNEASQAIQDDFALEEFDDVQSNADEKRYKCIGESGNKVLYVVYTVRNEATDEEIYRIISARLAEPDEKEIYEREKFNSGYFG